jgi:hypothetical protein
MELERPPEEIPIPQEEWEQLSLASRRWLADLAAAVKNRKREGPALSEVRGQIEGGESRSGQSLIF